MTRTVNLPRNIVMKSVKLDQYLCVITGSINLPFMHISRNQQCHNLANKMSSSKKSQVKSEVTQLTQLQSVSKAARKQIGTQPEVTRYCQDSTSKY